MRPIAGTLWYDFAVPLLPTFFLAALVAGAISVASLWVFAPSTNAAGATVKVVVQDGHGSGVHIGHGLVLTAAHVVGASTTVEVKDDKGRSQQAAVLWSNPKQDIALIQVAGLAADALDLDCRAPRVGEYVEARGNPRDIEFARTYGRISAGNETRGQWPIAFLVNITVLPGNSGGPLVDGNGNVLGLVVGVYGASALTVVVPSSVVCTSLARI